MSSAILEPSCSPVHAFLYYNPEQSKQHGQFVPQPPSSKKQASVHSSMSPISQPGREVPFPSSLWCRQPAQPNRTEQNFTIHAPTPLLAAAQSADALHKASGLLTPSSPPLMDGPAGGEFYFCPPTPVHSTTPVSQQWSMDEGCAGTVTPLEIQLPSTPELWKERSPISPGYQIPLQYLSNCPSPSLMLSSCPSLSPASDHSSSPDIDFCDPRQLTYPSPSTAEFDLSDLPKVSTSDEDHVFLPEQIQIKLEEPDLQCLLGTSITDEAPTGTINPAALFGGVKRTRDEEEEETWDLDHEDFSDEEDSILDEPSGNGVLMLPSPPASDLSRRSSVDPPSKKAKHESFDCDDLELDNIIAEARRRGVDEDVCADDSSFLSYSSCSSHDHQSLTPAPSDNDDSSATAEVTPAPVVRRGRKQSLTEDPSKTFVCHLCTRRFRRQEHLKRHFRSLHTKDKPFSCPECGKKFSRSDNLSQHARTHGSATIHMTVVDGEIVNEDAAGEAEAEAEAATPTAVPENGPLGIVLVDAKSAAEKLNEPKKNVQRRKKKRDE